MRVATHRIAANGLTHHVVEYGEPDDVAAILLHGFPDSSAVWRRLAPLLVAEGFRVITPDLRGFGETDMATRTEEYRIETGAAVDVPAILDALGARRAHIVGHDFGAPVAWRLAAERPDRFITLAALSVGHFRAYLAEGWEQKRRSFYILVHQMRGLCEALYRRNDWALLRRRWSAHGDIEEAIRLLARPGRLTAGLDWYRANLGLGRMLRPPREGELGPERVSIPTLGIWSDGEAYLTEGQMTASGAWVDGPWRYERIEGASHWIPYDAPERLAALLLGHWRDHS